MSYKRLPTGPQLVLGPFASRRYGAHRFAGLTSGRTGEVAAAQSVRLCERYRQVVTASHPLGAGLQHHVERAFGRPANTCEAALPYDLTQLRFARLGSEALADFLV